MASVWILMTVDRDDVESVGIEKVFSDDFAAQVYALHNRARWSDCWLEEHEVEGQ